MIHFHNFWRDRGKVVLTIELFEKNVPLTCSKVVC